MHIAVRVGTQWRLTTHNDDHWYIPALLNGFSAQQRSQDRIQVLLQVLYQNHVTLCQRSLYSIQVPFNKTTISPTLVT